MVRMIGALIIIIIGLPMIVGVRRCKFYIERLLKKLKHGVDVYEQTH